jgi:DNA-binding transcriptional ArsR family regulator
MKQHCQNINLMCEWIHLASRINTSTTTQATASDIAERYSIDVEQLMPMLKPCINLEVELATTIDKTMHDFDFFFSALHNEKQTLAQLLIPIFLDPKLHKDIDSITLEQWLNAFVNAVATIMDEDDAELFKTNHKITDFNRLTQVIMHSDLEESVKYRMIVATSQPTWCIKRLKEMYQVHESTWVDQEERMNALVFSTLNPYFDEYDSIYELIEEKISIKGVPIFDDINIIPSIFNFNTLMILNRNPFVFDLKEPLLHIGFLIFDLTQTLKQLSLNNERFQIVLKTLADKSKFEILKLCQEKTLYGQQVASLLKITTATASYHLNALVSLGYLTMNVEANRIYYETQSEKIANDLEHIKSIFSPKGL